VQTWDLTAIDTPGGTVSPVVLHSDEARAVLIGVEAGQELGEHQVTERAWVVVLDGEVELEADGDRPVAAGPGMLATFAPGERRALRSTVGARVLLILAPWPGEGHYRGGDQRPAGSGRVRQP
jgi:quercetin dioxygenase-like cupin family protein